MMYYRRKTARPGTPFACRRHSFHLPMALVTLLAFGCQSARTTADRPAPGPGRLVIYKLPAIDTAMGHAIVGVWSAGSPVRRGDVDETFEFRADGSLIRRRRMSGGVTETIHGVYRVRQGLLCHEYRSADFRGEPPASVRQHLLVSPPPSPISIHGDALHIGGFVLTRVKR